MKQTIPIVKTRPKETPIAWNNLKGQHHPPVHTGAWKIERSTCGPTAGLNGIDLFAVGPTAQPVGLQLTV